MTAYSLERTAFVQDDSNNLIAFQDLEEVLFVIHDGARANLSNETVVSWPGALYSLAPAYTVSPESHCELSRDYEHIVMMLIILVCTALSYKPTVMHSCELWANATLCKTSFSIINLQIALRQ
jgi:hypothetical protein